MVAEFSGHQQSLPKDFENAEKNIQRVINNAVFAHGSPDHPQFLTSSVSIGTGLDSYAGEAQQEVLRVTLKDPHVETIPSQVKEAVLASLSKIPALNENVAFEPDAKHAVALKEKLREFIGKGAKIPEKFLEWKGFDAEVAGMGSYHGVQDHAISGIGTFSAGTELFVSIPLTDKDTTETKPTWQVVEENLQSRKEEIKSKLAERVVKYNPGLDDAGKAELVAKVKALDINIEKQEQGDRFSDNRQKILKITLRSPEQVKFLAEEKPVAGSQVPDEKVKAAMASNPLSALSDEQRGKALGRAFLASGETAEAIFPLIAGREDMKRAIAKSLTHFAKDHPEQSKEVEAFLHDDMFKDHQQWNKPLAKREALKQAPIVNKDPAKQGEMTIDLTIPKGKVSEVIKQIAALDPSLNAPKQETPSSESQSPAKPSEAAHAHTSDMQFASLDSVEVVGATAATPALKAEAIEKAHAIIKKMLQEQREAMQAQQLELASAVNSTDQIINNINLKQAAASPVSDQAGEAAIKPFAERVVAGVVAANVALSKLGNVPEEVAKPLREANDAVQQAVKMEATRNWANRALASKQNASGMALG